MLTAGLAIQYDLSSRTGLGVTWTGTLTRSKGGSNTDEPSTTRTDFRSAVSLMASYQPSNQWFMQASYLATGLGRGEVSASITRRWTFE